jgi:hypothetical protein
MNDVDKLTLELFTNKTQYRKYLAKNEPDLFQEQEMLYFKMRESKSEILNRIEERMTSPNTASGSTQELLEHLVSCILQEIETEKRNTEFDSNSFYRGEEEADVLFPPDKMVDSRDEYDEPENREKKSFWSSDRVVQRSSSSEEAIIAHYPTNSEFRKRYIRKPTF